ncbi:MAG: hypothetical protein R3D85_00330 [Paracoccaceae bacterium]
MTCPTCLPESPERGIARPARRDELCRIRLDDFTISGASRPGVTAWP